MSRRTSWAVCLAFAICVVASAEERSISREYRNYAEGFAVRIPSGLHGLVGDENPQRGFTISLSSGGSVVVYGEPNSLEYKTTADGIRDYLSIYCTPTDPPAVSVVLIGKVRGSKGKAVCGNQVIVLMLAFRPRGGPIYWLKLETTTDHAAADEAVLKEIARGFKIVAWR